MRAAQWITCCWPGLSGLWLQGHGSGLATATGFTVLLNGVLAAQFLWPQVLDPQWIVYLWGAAFLAWCGGFWQAARQVARLPARRSPAAEEDLFIQAQTEYLKGHWFETEALLDRLLRANPEDADAHLMLAGLYRRTRRRAEALERLQQLKKLDGAAKWQLELRQELSLLERAAESDKSPEVNQQAESNELPESEPNESPEASQTEKAASGSASSEPHRAADGSSPPTSNSQVEAA